MNLSIVHHNQKKCNNESCGILQHATGVKEHNGNRTLNRINAIMKFQILLFILACCRFYTTFDQRDYFLYEFM